MIELLTIAIAVVAVIFVIKYIVNNSFPIMVGLVIAVGLVYAYQQVPEVGIYASAIGSEVQSNLR